MPNIPLENGSNAEFTTVLDWKRRPRSAIVPNTERTTAVVRAFLGSVAIYMISYTCPTTPGCIIDYDWRGREATVCEP